MKYADFENKNKISHTPEEVERQTLKNAYRILNDRVNELDELYNKTITLLNSMESISIENVNTSEKPVETMSDDENSNYHENNDIVTGFYDLTERIQEITSNINEKINQIQRMIE